MNGDGREGGVEPPARFPPGGVALAKQPFDEALFERLDELLAEGTCEEGRFDIEASEWRLTCLIHRSCPFIAGLQEGEVFSQVPLYDFVLRARQLRGATCTLIRTSLAEVMMAGVHYAKRPVLQASTRLVNLEHVLAVLAEERRDAALSFEREGTRTLLFLSEGRPARLFFGDPAADPREGGLEDRILLYAFSPGAPPGTVEVFTDLRLPPDPDAGKAFVELARAAKPCPPATLYVHLDDRELMQRPFNPPSMVIGRDPKCDVVLDNLAVSRRHARVVWERGAFFVEDLGSANRTLLNGRLVARARFPEGSVAEVGKFKIRLGEPRGTALVSETMFLPSVDLSPPGYLVGDGVSIKLDQDLLIGKQEGVDVKARGFRVRPIHARLARVRSGLYWLKCFGNGWLLVNGARQQQAEVGFGDTIAVGRSTFRVVASPGHPRG